MAFLLNGFFDSRTLRTARFGHDATVAAATMPWFHEHEKGARQSASRGPRPTSAKSAQTDRLNTPCRRGRFGRTLIRQRRRCAQSGSAPQAQEETTMAWTTPILVEICIGLEINGYLPAEF
jgi:coenzyme PQQ precursor peptide PqqA